MRYWLRKFGGWVLFVAVCCGAARGERLPIRAYNTADGLAHDRTRCLMYDSRGFLWIGAAEGLSRFDGYRFVNYGTENGLPNATINAILETRSGSYWVGTAKGAALLNPPGGLPPRAAGQSFNAAQPINSNGPALTQFTAYELGDGNQPNEVYKLIEDRTGRVWAGAQNGLFWWDAANNRFQRFTEGLYAEAFPVSALLEDANGALWAGNRTSLARRTPDGRFTRYTFQEKSGPRQNHPSYVTQADDGLLWFFDWRGLIAYRPDLAYSGHETEAFPWRELADDGSMAAPDSLAPGMARLYRLDPKLMRWPDENFNIRATRGRIWVGHNAGATWFQNGVFHSYQPAQGLSDNMIVDVAEDRDGNIWLATFRNGVCKLVRNGFTSYGVSEGLAHTRVVDLKAGADGATIASSGSWTISRCVADKCVAVQPNIGAARQDTWFYGQNAVQDAQGELWVATKGGLYRFPAVRDFAQLARTPPRAVYTVKDGLPSNIVDRLLLDMEGNIWAVCGVDGGRALARWERATGRIRSFSEADGVPRSVSYKGYCDPAGRVWFGTEDGMLLRFAAGRWRVWRKSDGLPESTLRTFYLDQAGRLWAGTILDGLLRIDRPEADHPGFTRYTTGNGLSSNNVRAVSEDEWGRLYVGVGRGVERLDFSGGALAIKRYSTADGLANTFVNEIFRDANGALWFGTLDGLSRFTPEKETPAAPLQVFLSGLRAGGVPYLNADLGASDVAGPELATSANQLQIDYFGLSFSAGEMLRYQYKFDGQEWSPLTEQRSYNASLAPGRYTFWVRAINADGAASEPARVAFRILPPIWARWWFIVLAVLALAGCVWLWERARARRLRHVLALQRAEQALNRSRAERLAEIERVRRRIATDLHDDIGSSLTQIAILSEVIRQRTGNNGASDAAQPLEMIAAASRELVDSMSDIVWAINPEKDHLRDLSQRMRRFASDVFAAGNIKAALHFPDAAQEIKLGANMRREIFLIFKESVNNMVRHADCTEADITFSCAPDALRLELRDNGQGFDTAQESDGHGLASMRERAQALNGALTIDSQPGGGTVVTLVVPLEARLVVPPLGGSGVE
jgi:signal transduction histidine kinase/ligand-binding sensor domain-containing protein